MGATCCDLFMVILNEAKIQRAEKSFYPEWLAKVESRVWAIAAVDLGFVRTGRWVDFWR